MARHPRVAIIHALHDGVQSMCTGVGRVAGNIISTFDRVRRTAIPNCRVSLHLITTEYHKQSPAYNREIEQRSLAAVEAYEGTLNTVSTPSVSRSVYEIWGGPNRWRRAGAEAFNIAMQIAERYDRSFVFAHDITFANLLNQLEWTPAQNTRFVWVPHSTARIHRYGAIDRQREVLEFEVVEAINHDSRAFCGAIGRFMSEHLNKEYGIERQRIISLKNGLVVDRESYPSIDSDTATAMLSRIGVPDAVPIVLFWGRAVPHKGVDLLVRAWCLVRSNAHLLVIAPPETGPPAYIEDLRQAIAALGHRATGIFRFDPLLPFAALSHPRTSAVVIPSRAEPCSLTAMEAKLYSQRATFVILMPTVDGLAEQAVPNGTKEVGLDECALARAIEEILHLATAERRRMARRAFNSLADWNFAINHSKALDLLWRT